MDLENIGFLVLVGTVSKQNSILNLLDPYRILWKAVFDESRM